MPSQMHTSIGVGLQTIIYMGGFHIQINTALMACFSVHVTMCEAKTFKNGPYLLPLTATFFFFYVTIFYLSTSHTFVTLALSPPSSSRHCIRFSHPALPVGS